MIDPFTRTRFDSAYQLETWYPVGRLDATMAMSMAKHIGFEESIADEPFNRYGDLSLLTGIHLDFIEVAVFAAERRAAYYEGAPVKSAILAISRAAYAVAHMFAALMERSPIDVRIFRTVEDAAEWLGVPPAVLQAES